MVRLTWWCLAAQIGRWPLWSPSSSGGPSPAPPDGVNSNLSTCNCNTALLTEARQLLVRKPNVSQEGNLRSEIWNLFSDLLHSMALVTLFPGVSGTLVGHGTRCPSGHLNSPVVVV